MSLWTKRQARLLTIPAYVKIGDEVTYGDRVQRDGYWFLNIPKSRI